MNWTRGGASRAERASFTPGAETSGPAESSAGSLPLQALVGYDGPRFARRWFPTPMHCPACDLDLPAGSRFCTACGVGVAAASASGSTDLDGLLARANLHRLRGEWAQAAERCATVLQQDEANADALSLLGDIYDDQGRWTDAQHWYRRALSVQPDCEAVRCKLARAIATLEARERQQSDAGRIDGAPPPLLREAIQRVVGTAGSAVCAVLLVVLLFGLARPPPGDSEGSGPGRQLYAPSGMTDAELQTLSLLAANAGRQHPAAQIRTLFLWPGDHRAELSLVLHAPWRQGDPQQDRFLIAREAYRFAFHLSKLDADLETISARVLGKQQRLGPETLALYSASFSPDSLVIDPERITFDELAVATQLPRWHERLAP